MNLETMHDDPQHIEVRKGRGTHPYIVDKDLHVNKNLVVKYVF